MCVTRAMHPTAATQLMHLLKKVQCTLLQRVLGTCMDFLDQMGAVNATSASPMQAGRLCRSRT